MNREQKRMMQRQGQLGPDGEPVSGAAAPEDRQRRVRAATATRTRANRTSPVQFTREVRAELRKVAWPTRLEVRNYSIVVLITLIILISLIFVLDYAFSKSVLFLFNS